MCRDVMEQQKTKGLFQKRHIAFDEKLNNVRYRTRQRTQVLLEIVTKL